MEEFLSASVAVTVPTCAPGRSSSLTLRGGCGLSKTGSNSFSLTTLMKIVIVVDRTPSLTVTSISKEILCSKLSSASNRIIPRPSMENIFIAFPFTPSPITAVIVNTS